MSKIKGKRNVDNINIGTKINRLTIISEPIRKNNSIYYICKCDCGKEKMIRKTHILNNAIKSCGCYNKECITKHGLCNTRLNRIWKNIKARCYNPNNTRYKNYGGRGITVCDEWLNNFKIFYDWAINNGYQEDLTIDRINVDGNYEPSNCRWITLQEQQNNRTNNHYFVYNNKKYTIATFSKEKNIKEYTIRYRLINNKDLITGGDLKNEYVEL